MYRNKFKNNKKIKIVKKILNGNNSIKILWKQ